MMVALPHWLQTGLGFIKEEVGKPQYRTYCRKTPSPTEERRAPHPNALCALGWGATKGQVGLVTFAETYLQGRECMPRERRVRRNETAIRGMAVPPNGFAMDGKPRGFKRSRMA